EAIEVQPLSDAFAPRSVAVELARLLPEAFPGHRAVAPLLERLERGLAAEEVPELVSLVPGATVPPWAHFEGATVVALEPEAILAEALALHARAAEQRDRRVDALPLDPARVLVSVDELAARLDDGPSLHLRDVDPEGRGAHFPARPVRRYAGDLRRLVADLQAQHGRTVILL